MLAYRMCLHADEARSLLVDRNNLGVAAQTARWKSFALTEGGKPMGDIYGVRCGLRAAGSTTGAA